MATVAAALALAAVLVHGTQASLDLLAGVRGARVNVCLVDLLIAAGFGFWLLRKMRRLDWSWPPVSFGAMVGVGWLILSLIPFLKGSAAQETIIYSAEKTMMCTSSTLIMSWDMTLLMI